MPKTSEGPVQLSFCTGATGSRFCAMSPRVHHNAERSGSYVLNE
jgi:hypothetical protein